MQPLTDEQREINDEQALKNWNEYVQWLKDTDQHKASLSTDVLEVLVNRFATNKARTEELDKYLGIKQQQIWALDDRIKQLEQQLKQAEERSNKYFDGFVRMEESATNRAIEILRLQEQLKQAVQSLEKLKLNTADESTYRIVDNVLQQLKERDIDEN